MIVTIADFKNEAAIPGLIVEVLATDYIGQSIRDNVQDFIDKYEPKFLKMFFDSNEETAYTYADIVTYLALEEADRNDDVLDSYIENLKEPISHYIAFYYFRNDISSRSVSGGETTSNAANSKKADANNRIVLLWNQMVELITDIVDTEEWYTIPNVEIFKRINPINI
jgi:hypothetical protein